MSNVQRTLWNIFVILFVLFAASTAFAQQDQQPDSALTQSQADKIIEKIDQLEKNMLKSMHELELKMRDHVDTKFKELDVKIGELNTKFHELDKKVAVLRSDVDKLFTIIITIAVAVGAHLLIFIGSHIYSYWRNKTNVVLNRPLTKGEIGQYFESTSDLDTVIRLEPDDYTTYNNRGADKVHLGHYNAAISDFDEAIRLNPEKADLYFNRGFVKMKLGREVDAKQDFQKALRLAQEAGDAKLIDQIKKHI